jgi:hypothetical protein
MAYTYEELKVKTVAQLREIASGIENEAVKGYTQLNKDHLLAAICKALNIDMHAHHHTEGVDKADLKSQIRNLKKQRDEALANQDHKKLKSVRRQIHHLNRLIKRASV